MRVHKQSNKNNTQALGDTKAKMLFLALQIGSGI